MSEKLEDSNHVDLKVSLRELRYFISCGMALIQNVPNDSLPTYCGLNKDEIVEVSLRLREVAEREGMDM
ncbi:hypothetical protein [Pseudomonas frederiksbergensis]|uniref:hypothetical protein n=1 Tax=Pseudomonas frederiksbergensis TaxID=104087 RepID=UPI002DBFA323|nr:hypothetical protein [Pseudomonas frederiksbergensis]WRV66985.1 hypothetical protein VQ575_19160 [Pseudomonas frederiksbergensis]